jgi:ketosteroid isomerase-like protein
MSSTAWAGLMMAASILVPGGASIKRMDPPDRAVWAVVDSALDAAQSGDVKTLRQAYMPGCVFVDEFAPFAWSGAHSLDDYLASAARMYKGTGMTGTIAAHDAPGYVYVAGGKAYLTVPLRIAAKASGKPYRESGILTFALQKSTGGWKIAAQTWTKLRENRPLTSNR